MTLGVLKILTVVNARHQRDRAVCGLNVKAYTDAINYLSQNDNVFTREFLLQLANDLLLNLLPWFQLGEWHEDNDSLAALTGVELAGRFEVQLGERGLKLTR